MSGKAKISDLKKASVVDEQVRCFNVSMQHVLVVQVLDAFEELQQVTLDLCLRKVDARILEKT